MKTVTRSLMMVTVFSWFSLPAAAQAAEELSYLERKVVTIVDAAYMFILANNETMEIVQQALEHDPRFIDRENELYIFMHTYDEDTREVVCRAHGIRTELIGKSMGSLRTPTGRLLFHEFIELVETEGEGWLEYDWLNPFSDRLQTKYSYVKGIVLNDGRKAWIGCGIWREEE